MNLLVYLARAPIRIYRRFISPWKPRTCRFSPTCSAYALEALEKRGFWMGTVLTAWRLMRCQPYGTPGHDPVPTRGFGGVVPPAPTKAEVPRDTSEDRGGARDPSTLDRGGNAADPKAP